MAGETRGVRPWTVGAAGLLAVVLAVAAGLAGHHLLTAGTGPSAPAGKSGTGDLRTDLDPLRTRFPALAGATAARWMSGTFGRADTPGPSLYWIDAVVTLPPAEARRLTTRHAPTAQGATPDVVEGLRDHLPPGPFLTGDALDRAIGHDDWRPSVYLDEKTGQVVLVASGE